MTTIAELGSFLAAEKAAAGLPATPALSPIPPVLVPAANGTPANGAASGPPAAGASQLG